MSQITALNGAEHPADVPEHLTKQHLSVDFGESTNGCRMFLI